MASMRYVSSETMWSFIRVILDCIVTKHFTHDITITVAGTNIELSFKKNEQEVNFRDKSMYFQPGMIHILLFVYTCI